MTRLYYVADPMCSWCWGFSSQLERVQDGLGVEVEWQWIMGGLAPDSDEPMPAEVRAYVQDAWRAVAERTGATFNWDFWEQCEPRRSTYPACRAVLAASRQGAGLGPRMFQRIQRAYYLEARNPSDTDVLIELAADPALGLDAARFADDLGSDDVEQALRRDLEQTRRLRVRGFPSLILEESGARTLVAQGFALAGEVLARIRS